MKEITLGLTIEEINTILNALGKQPYADVYQLINKIQGQASHQLENNQNAQNAAHETV